MKYLLLSCALILSMGNISLASKRPASDTLEGETPRTEKKIYIGDDERFSPDELRTIIIKNPNQIINNFTLQNQIVEYYLNNRLALPIEKIVSVLPNLLKQALLSHQYAEIFIRHTSGGLIPQDLIEIITTDAMQGNTEAQFNLGLMFMSGWKKEDDSVQASDIDKAFELFTAAAQQGYARTQYNLGFMFQHGWQKTDGSRQAPDPEKAVEFYTASAKQGSAVAQNRLGFMFQHGWQKADGSRQAPDLDKAVALFTASAKQGDDDAQANLGFMFINGWQKSDGSWQAPDPDKAVALLTAAANQGNAPAQSNLGFMFQLGWQKVDGSRQAPDPDKAVEFYTAAANNGLRQARSLLSRLISWRVEHGENIDITVPFTLSNQRKAQIESARVNLEFWKGLSNPNSSLKDTSANPLLYSLAHKVSEDLQSFEKHMQCFNIPGFLTTSVKPHFDHFKTCSQESFLSAYNVRGRLYTCLGHDNVKAASQLLALLDRMQEHPSLDAIISGLTFTLTYTTGDDESKQDTNDTIQELTTMKNHLKEISTEIFEQIQSEAPRRNKRLEVMLGEQPLEE